MVVNRAASSALDTTVAPIVVPASGAWHGNDGPWSTFDIHVGTPPQAVGVLVSTAASETWVISDNKTQGGCLLHDSPLCPQSRGGLFNINKSSTWNDQGFYTLGVASDLLDYTGDLDIGDYGFDALGIGLPDTGRVKFKSQTIAALATKDFYLGSLGLNPYPTNFTGFNDPQVSFLSSLKESNTTPSLSYAYSAGAQYRQNTTASLTLGGYDASKFDLASGATLPMASDISRDLVVGLQAITVNGANKSLLNGGILTYVDATVPHIWLPLKSCSLFEEAFGLVYNSTVDRYLVNETLHGRLKSNNASVSYLLGSDISGKSTVNITLPYSSFDLQVGPPIVNTTQTYFPLRRADNETQYTLGRTFLQEAYLIVDYERSNFSIYQNSWAPNATSQIVGISPVPNPTTVTGGAPSTSNGVAAHSNRGQLLATILTPIVVCVVLALPTVYFLRKRRARRKAKQIEEVKAKPENSFYSKPEMDGTGKHYNELDADPESNTAIKEIQSKAVIPSISIECLSELEGSKGGAELKGTLGGVEKGDGKEVAQLRGDGHQ